MSVYNKYKVALCGGDIAILRPPHNLMAKQEALVLAAWLVGLADNAEVEKYFLPALKEIRRKS